MVEGIAGRVAIVTGAGRGIGQGVALRLAKEGANVVANDLDQRPLDETLRQIEEAGGSAVGLAASVTDADIGERLASLAVERFGGLHIVVTAAGFLWDGMIHRMTDEQFNAIVDVHLGGTFRVVRDAFKVMREARASGEGARRGRARPAHRDHLVALRVREPGAGELLCGEGRDSRADAHDGDRGGDVQRAGKLAGVRVHRYTDDESDGIAERVRERSAPGHTGGRTEQGA